MVQYKKFVLGDLFSITGIKSTDAGKVSFVKNGDAQFVGRTSAGYGIQGMVNSAGMGFEPNKANTISVSQVGTIVAQYRDFPYYTSQNITKFSADFLNPEVGLYFCGIINNWLYKAGFVGYHTVKQSDLKKQVVLLPVTPAGDPDFEYMAMRIRELEAERIRELEAYLHVTGLDNTILSASEAQALTQKVQWKKFRIGDMFDIEKVRGVNKSGLTKPTVDDSYDYITRTSQNNGIESITGSVNDRELNSAGTISLGLLQMTFFYRDRPWYAGQFVRKIVPKIELTNEQTLYFVTLFNALRPMLLGILVRNVDETFLNTELQLPVTVTGDIDFDYMQNYIRATEKQTIKGVVEYKDRVIEETKKVVNGLGSDYSDVY